MGVLGSNSARRATLRIARRDALRHKGRSALIALMVAVPVFAAAAVSVLARAEDSSSAGYAALELGSPGSNTTQASVDVGSATGPIEQSANGNGWNSTQQGEGKPLTSVQFEQKLRAALPAGDTATPRREEESQLLGFGDRLLKANVVELDLRAGWGDAVSVAGRFPQAADEVVATKALARADDLRTGDRLTYQGRTVTVVGVAAGLPLAGNKQVIGPVGSLLPVEPGDLAASSTSSSWFVTGPAPVTWPDVRRINAFGGAVLSRYVVAHPPARTADDDSDGVDSSFVATGAVVVGLVLLQIALMAGPAIAVGTRRNERGLALLASVGGQPRHLRAVVLAGGALVGLVASTAATATGAAVGGLAVKILREGFDVRVAPVELHPWDLVILAAVGTLTATAAALLPARRVGKLDVVAALTGRRPIAVPRLRVPAIGLALAAGGLALAWWAAGGGRQFPTVAGLGLAEIGLVVASPAIVGLLARLAAHTPFASRFALRDAARQRGRTAPAVAAVLAAIAGGMTAVVYISASTEADRAAYQSSAPIGTASVYLEKPFLGRSTDVATYPPVAARTALQQTLPVRTAAVAYAAAENKPVSVWQKQTSCSDPPDDDGTAECGESGSTPWFAGPDLAPAIAPTASSQVAAALRAGRAVVFRPDLVRDGGTVSLSVGGDDPGKSRQSLPVTLVPGYPHVSTVLLPRSLATTFGVRLHPTALLAGTTRTPTTTEVEQARSALQRNGIDAETFSLEEGFVDHTGPVLLGALVAALLVALIGTFTAVGLAAAEARADVATLAAVGAAPGLRRRIGAAQAGAIAVPAAVLGVISGTAAGWALIRLNSVTNASWQPRSAWHLVLPWPQALGLGVGIPLVAMLVGFLGVRSRLVLVRRLGG